MTKEEMGDILEPFYQYVGRQSDDEEWVKLRDLVYELVGKLERPKGKWIKRNGYDRRDNFYACSECGRIINIICGAHLEDYPFCHCGADMRGKE